MNKKKAYVYVDGLNLFYAHLKGSKYKWLDINKLVSFYFPEYKIEKIKYFTAIVRDTKDDPSKSNRHKIYLRALKTLKNIEIILGYFLRKEKIVFIPEKTEKKKIQRVKVNLDGLRKLLPLSGRNYIVARMNEEKRFRC